MIDKDERTQEAEKHIALMRTAFSSETESSIEHAIVYPEGEGRELALPEPTSEKTEVFVTHMIIPNALKYAVGKTVIVDPAAFMRAAGSYKEGGYGPEQILCSRSNLFPILTGLRKDYYLSNRGYYRGYLFTDRALYVPDVVFVDDAGEDRGGEGVRRADVLVVAEPNRRRALENLRSERECELCIEQRIETIFHIAAAHECATLITGAFGCGRSGYDETQVAHLYKQWIDEHQGVFARLIFSVPRSMADAFFDAFGHARLWGKPKREPAKPDSDETHWNNESFTSSDLPEGVTLR